MNAAVAAAGGALAATAVAVLLDRPRRARIRDRALSAAASSLELQEKARRDAKNRVAGALMRLSSFSPREVVPDEKLVARVRARLGRVVRHPHAIHVSATNGRIILAGPILHSEVGRLIRSVRRIRGVRGIENRLEIHDSAEGTPSLQGKGRAPRGPELLHEHWTPSLRVAAGGVGAFAVTSGLTRLRSVAGLGLTGIGLLLVARATLDEPIARILGIDTRRNAVELRKTITIEAPVEEVFAYWADLERFGEIMDHVESVKRTDERRSRWRVRGPFGGAVEWDAETTVFVPNERIGWKSVEGSIVESAGLVRFEPVSNGEATRLDVRLGYNPVAGYVGHGIAALFGVDAKRSLDEDLLRLKSVLERGRTTAHGEAVTHASS